MGQVPYLAPHGFLAGVLFKSKASPQSIQHGNWILVEQAKKAKKREF
jgi:hypothetical protein